MQIKLLFLSEIIVSFKQLEEVFLSQGSVQLISLAKHYSSATQNSCIVNIFIMNDTDKISLSGVIKDRYGKTPFTCIIIDEFNLDKASCKSPTQIQEYSYSSKNVDSLTKLDLELVEIYKNLKFDSFFLLFKNCIDQCCKLATPKCSKRNPINNPWITDAIIKTNSSSMAQIQKE